MAYLWQLSALELDSKVFVCGTALDRKTMDRETDTVVGNTAKVVASYFKDPWANKKLTVRFHGKEHSLRTSEKGYFSGLFDGSIDKSMKILVNGKELEAKQNYPVFFEQTGAEVEVVSDIDDTVIHSYTSSDVKRIATILFRLPEKRRTVEFTFQLFHFMKRSNCRTSYLSKSEGNLFDLLTSVFKQHELPNGSLFLTKYLDASGLMKGTKDKEHKNQYLRMLIDHQPSKKFILLGDDTQKDMEVYAGIAKDYGEKILKIYIRQTGLDRNERQKQLWRELESSGAPCLYFSDEDEFEKEKQYLEKHVRL